MCDISAHHCIGQSGPAASSVKRILANTQEQLILNKAVVSFSLLQSNKASLLNHNVTCCSSGDEAEVDILSGAGALLGKNKQLAPGLIETTRLRDANQQEPSKSVVQSVEFHPAGQLLLTAGLDKRLRLFQVHHSYHAHQDRTDSYHTVPDLAKELKIMFEKEWILAATKARMALSGT